MNKKIIKLPEIISVTGLSGSSIYGLIKKPKLPKQIKQSESSTNCVKSLIALWLNERTEAFVKRGEIMPNTSKFVSIKPLLTSNSLDCIYKSKNCGTWMQQVENWTVKVGGDK